METEWGQVIEKTASDVAEPDQICEYGTVRGDTDSTHYGWIFPWNSQKQDAQTDGIHDGK